jgi:large subunit ribosomal protein L17
MRHRAKGRQLSRTSSHKRAMLNNMATSLFAHGRVITTEAKAKELRPFAEKLITLARRGDLHARRLVERRIKDRETLGLLFREIGPRFAARPGGYTRILKLGHREGDGADVARIELLAEWEPDAPGRGVSIHCNNKGDLRVPFFQTLLTREDRCGYDSAGLFDAITL